MMTKRVGAIMEQRVLGSCSPKELVYQEILSHHQISVQSIGDTDDSDWEKPGGLQPN
jgi:hypothetical protein